MLLNSWVLALLPLASAWSVTVYNDASCDNIVYTNAGVGASVCLNIPAQNPGARSIRADVTEGHSATGYSESDCGGTFVGLGNSDCNSDFVWKSFDIS